MNRPTACMLSRLPLGGQSPSKCCREAIVTFAYYSSMIARMGAALVLDVYWHPKLLQTGRMTLTGQCCCLCGMLHGHCRQRRRSSCGIHTRQWHVGVTLRKAFYTTLCCIWMQFLASQQRLRPVGKVADTCDLSWLEFEPSILTYPVAPRQSNPIGRIVDGF